LGTAAIALYLLWQHRLGWALAVMFIPSIIISIILVRFADLTAYK
jgi:hypothetical protein